MWTRSLLKQNAWNLLKGYYWTAFGVTALCSLITGAFSMNLDVKVEDNSLQNPLSVMHTELEQVLGRDISFQTFVYILIAISLISVVASLLFAAFVSNPLICGKNRYFLRARTGDSDFGNLFSQFKNGRYLHTVKILFRRDISVLLWSLLLIIPGIIKSYEYALIPYLLADNPRLSKERAFEISRSTMDGEKWKLFVLQLSFLGWYLLGALCCGIGMLFVLPYPEATLAEFYTCMKAKMQSMGIALEDELTDPDETIPPTGGWGGAPQEHGYIPGNGGYPGQSGSDQGFNPYDFQ